MTIWRNAANYSVVECFTDHSPKEVMSRCLEPLPSVCLQPPKVVGCISLTRYADARVLQQPYQLVMIQAWYAQGPSCPWSYPPRQPVNQAEFSLACPGTSSPTTWKKNTTAAIVIVQKSLRGKIVLRRPLWRQESLPQPVYLCPHIFCGFLRRRWQLRLKNYVEIAVVRITDRTHTPPSPALPFSVHVSLLRYDLFVD